MKLTMPTPGAVAAAPSVVETAELVELRQRLARLETGRVELAAVVDQARAQLVKAEEHLAEVATASGGRCCVSAGGLGGGEDWVSWQFSWPAVKAPSVAEAERQANAVRVEGQPTFAALRKLDSAINVVRAELDRQSEQARAEQERRARERQQRSEAWRAAGLEGSAPSWQDESAAILTRLGLPSDPR